MRSVTSDIADDGFPDMNTEPREEGVRPSTSNGVELPAAWPQGRPGRRATWSACGLGAFQNTMTASPINFDRSTFREERFGQREKYREAEIIRGGCLDRGNP